jgi:hypothetical protein
MNIRLSFAFITAIAVLALSGLPSTCLAGEFNADCAAGIECGYTFEGSEIRFGSLNGFTMGCPRVTGNGTIKSGTSTGSFQLLIHECHETISGFNFKCSSAGQPPGTVTTNSMVTHLVYLDQSRTTPGILLTGMNLTFTCPVYGSTTITGNMLGHIEDPQCNLFTSQHSISFAASSDGQQKYTQVTTTGTVFDLTANDDSGGEYKTVSIANNETFSHSSNQIKFTC